MKLSLVIPCYNEAANLPLLLERCALTARSDAEVILVDNGSTDNTPTCWPPCCPHAAASASNAIRAMATAFRLRAAQGEILAWTRGHAADPMTPSGSGAIGARCRLFVKGRRYGRPVADVFFTIGMSLFETLLLRTRLWDINAQPTMFHRDFFASWDRPPHDFSLDLYAYYLARSRGLAVKRFPVRFGERAHGTSHWNVNWAARENSSNAQSRSAWN